MWYDGIADTISSYLPQLNTGATEASGDGFAFKQRSSRHKAIILIGIAVSLYAARFAAKDEGHGGTRGKGFRVVRHWLRGQGTICRDMLGMSPNTFDALKRNLTEDGGLKGGKDISAREKLAIFLYVSRVAASTRQAAGVFGHTPTTIGLAFKAVLRALMKAKVYRRHVYLPPPSAPVPARITDDPGLNSFFKKVIGAIDGSHVPAHAPAALRESFWNRKGKTSFNVLAVCDFDMCFTYILSGWEGSAADSGLWQKALENGLRLPAGKMLLGDSGFPLSPHLLIPYRGVRYHLKEYSAGTKNPRNAKELYNRRHAGARSVIERIFGVLQARFKILTTGCHYDLQVQADLFPALAVVHNLIRRLDPAADIEPDLVNDDASGAGEDPEPHAPPADAEAAAAARDRISKKMWKKYKP
ncbi:hypothetical protein A4X03_0g9004 [Tilletia caries]|uniref:DDE Tnp4 domain-containing protein n=1 Tax=Tilletia caries TaxID=13290 RepID=A0A8T8SDW5_9BASI|nr:hypothetical protein A4X03_0g9004 [Tilletia caries]